MTILRPDYPAMATYKRQLRIALDRNSSSLLNADIVFPNARSGHKERTAFHRGKYDLACPECDQKLGISSSKFHRLHFKHAKGTGPCILKEHSLSDDDMELFNQILWYRESDRHKYLKQRIAQLLKITSGVDPLSVRCDDQMIVRGTEKRRPDVYAKFDTKEIVFEIQLSNLSYRYILHRHDFYKKYGIYLIWILDDFDIHSQGQMVTDIKYLNQYHNFFKLDETVQNFNFLCDYKCARLTDTNELLTPWVKKSVGLSDLKFDDIEYQVYYHNYIEDRNAKEADQTQRQYQEDEWNLLLKTQEKITEIKEMIALNRKEKRPSYAAILRQLSSMTEYEVAIFNKDLGIQNTELGKVPALHKWLREFKYHEFHFIEFLLMCEKIWLNVNDCSPSGETTFQLIQKNAAILAKHAITLMIFKHGYLLTEEDEQFIKRGSDEREAERQICQYQLFMKLKEATLIDEAIKFDSHLFAIESAKRKRVTGFRFAVDGWVSLANNMIEYYPVHWTYFECSFKYYKVWDLLMTADKNGTFQNKLRAHNSKYAREPDNQFERILRASFPELLQAFAVL